MELYFAPLACSMASRIALYEAQADAAYVPVELRNKLLPNGGDFRQVNPMGMVPTLRTDDGLILTPRCSPKPASAAETRPNAIACSSG